MFAMYTTIFLKDKYFFCMYMSVCLSVYLCPVKYPWRSGESIRWILYNWSYRSWWAAMWVLETKPKSSTRTRSYLNSYIFSLASRYVWSGCLSLSTQDYTRVLSSHPTSSFSMPQGPDSTKSWLLFPTAFIERTPSPLRLRKEKCGPNINFEVHLTNKNLFHFAWP